MLKRACFAANVALSLPWLAHLDCDECQRLLDGLEPEAIASNITPGATGTAPWMPTLRVRY